MTTKKNAIKLAERVEAWQKRLGPLGIGHFRIDQVSIVDETPGGAGAAATAQMSHSYDSVNFWFTHEFVDESDERHLDEIIIHEWLHVVMRDLDVAIESVEDELGEGARSRWGAWVTHEREGLVDKMARQIYALYNANNEEVVR